MMDAAELRGRAEALLAVLKAGSTDAPDPDAVDAILADATALAEGVAMFLAPPLTHRLMRAREESERLWDELLERCGDAHEVADDHVHAVLNFHRGQRAVIDRLANDMLDKQPET